MIQDKKEAIFKEGRKGTTDKGEIKIWKNNETERGNSTTYARFKGHHARKRQYVRGGKLPVYEDTERNRKKKLTIMCDEVEETNSTT